jgi:hypothetical protein
MGKVKLNGKEITQEELEAKKEEASQKKGVQIVEVKPQEYKTRIRG